MSLPNNVARNLLAARLDRKLSQQAVAQKAGVSVSYVSMLERHVRTTPLETLEALAKALRVPPARLLQEPAAPARRAKRRS